MIKELIRKILIGLRIDLTKNIYYDRLTLKILDKVVKPNSNCIDIGCHKGEIMNGGDTQKISRGNAPGI